MSENDDNKSAPIRTRGPGHLQTQKKVDAWCRKWINKPLPSGKRELVLHDGNALNLIKRSQRGGFVWVLEMTWAGKGIELRLGQHPLTTLEEARNLAAKLRKRAAQGKDPRRYLDKKRDKAAQRQEESEISSNLTFKVAMEKAIKDDVESDEGAETTRKGRRLRLRKHFVPIHDVPLRDLTHAQIKALIEEVAKKSRDTAERMWYDIAYVSNWAIREEHIKRSPLEGKRPPPVVLRYQRECDAQKHVYPAIVNTAALGEMRWRNRQVNCSWQVRDATDFQLLTGLRSSNVAKMQWSWYDAVEGTLTIPRGEMKDKDKRTPSTIQLGGQVMPDVPIDFCIPLSSQLQAYLNGRSREGVYVFPSPKSVNKHITIESLSAHLRIRMKLRGKHVPHGARSAIYTWAYKQRQPDAPRLLYEAIAIQMLLDHQWRSRADRSYTREEALEIMRPIYQDWNDLLDEAERQARLHHENELVSPF